MVTNKAISAVAAAFLVFAASEAMARGADDLPDGLRGFSGRVRGTVVERGEANTFMLKVERVLNVWPKNEAREPTALAGRSIRVGPRWAKGEDGRWHPAPLHESFIRTLRSGEDLTLEVRNAEGSHFAILELTGEQRERAQTREGGERPIGERERPATAETGVSTERAVARRDARIAELEREVIALREEVAQLRKLLEEGRRRR